MQNQTLRATQALKGLEAVSNVTALSLSPEQKAQQALAALSSAAPVLAFNQQGVTQAQQAASKLATLSSSATNASMHGATGELQTVAPQIVLDLRIQVDSNGQVYINQ